LIGSIHIDSAPESGQNIKVNSLSNEAGSFWLSAEDAAALLAVRRSSLYSYVSRGLLRAQKKPGERGSRYLQSDVLRLARQRQAVRNPASLAQSTLDWGQPVLPSSITLVQDGHLYYRGRNAVQWAKHATLEQTAKWLWQGFEVTEPPHVKSGAAATGFTSEASSGLPTLESIQAAWHLQAHTDNPPTLLHAMCTALLGTPRRDASQAIHERLQAHWDLDTEAADTLRHALVLCADHELNASSFAVRVVASTGASLQACVGAGLAALSGPLHGGVTQQIDQQWDEWHSHSAIAPSLAALLQHTQRDSAPQFRAGFGHPLYPHGDPRSEALLQHLPPASQRQCLLDKVYKHTGLRPSLDYALVAIQRTLCLPSGTAFLLFALGRTAGWIAHALEQRASGQLIRPRAVYVGSAPQAPASAHTSTSGRMIRFR
jgi:citrate synthase